MLVAGITAGAVPLLPTYVAQAISAESNTRASEGGQTMGFVTTKDGTEIFYKNWGSKNAQPIVFHHGWPLSADDWDNQMLFFLHNGYRVIAHDRRGHGRSTQTDIGNEMD
ncbi:MAG: alpha/beta hydrolase, partial [Mesorhizobium sp.]